MALHAFVVMPLGDKEGIHFDRVYGELVKPALVEAGFEVFRADQEMRAGEIRKDMFQELLRADLVVADLTIDNPNVFYEIVVRHGLRTRGFVQIGCRPDDLPFDITTDRTLRYTLKDGAPNPATLADEKKKLGDFARATVQAWAGRKVSPVFQPRRVFLFSGHMVDKAGRTPPRFPDKPDLLARAAQAIGAKLDDWGACPDDLAICGGACGGDTLFAEACLARGAQVHLHLQFPEPAFLQASVSFAGEKWVDRFHQLKANKRCTVLVQPDELGPLPEGTDPYERNNLWQLYTALSHGPEKVHFLGLWDGQGGDGPGGTKHMVETVERFSGRTAIIKPAELG